MPLKYLINEEEIAANIKSQIYNKKRDKKEGQDYLVCFK